MAFKTNYSVFLAALLVCSLALGCFNIAQAQSIPKPSVPEFTLQYVKHPYDVPPTYSVDQYTGQNIVISPGYHTENRSVEITIKNQPFTPIMLDATHQANFYYNVSYRGHYGSDWSYFVPFNSTLGWYTPLAPQSTTDYTVIAFKDLPDEVSSFDFRVQAQIGYYDEYHMPYADYSFTGQVSGWSNAQTVDMPGNSQSSPTATPYSQATASPTATPTTPNTATDSQQNWVLYSAIAGLSIAVAVLTVAVAFMYKKIRGLEPKQNGA